MMYPDTNQNSSNVHISRTSRYYLYFYHNDHLGTPQQMTSVSGAVVWAAQYGAFGQAQVDAGASVVNNLRFPGQYYDGETGLHYNYKRCFDQTIGRYISADPIGLKGGSNLFTYAFNNSIKHIDNKGLSVIIHPRWPQDYPTPEDFWNYFISKVPCVECDFVGIGTCVFGSPESASDCALCIKGLRECKDFKNPYMFGVCMLQYAIPCGSCANSVKELPSCIKENCKIGHLDPCEGCVYE